MPEDEKQPEAAVAPAEKLTQEEFQARMDALMAEARAAGLKPTQTITKSLVQEGLAALQDYLAELSS